MSRSGAVAAPATGRRAGAVVLVVLGAAALLAMNVWPGWTAIPFLTAETEQVLGLVNLSIALGIAVNLAVAVVGLSWMRDAGDVITSSVGIVVAVRLLSVFPFRFVDGGIDWAVLVRVVLWVGLIGSVIGTVAALVRLVGQLGHRG
jgi:hypothetical protein